MTATIHKRQTPLHGETGPRPGLSFFRSRIPARMRLFCAAGILMTGTAPARAIPSRPTTADALAYELAQRDSATATLQQHCPTPITARLLDRQASPALQQDARLALKTSSTARLDIRHVQLLCGTDMRSEAWNLYLPDRLTPQARRTLANGRTPFGRAVGEGNFTRQRLGGRFADLPNGIVLENRAILHRRTDGKGFAYLIERYTDSAPGFRETPETSSDAAPHQEPASAP
ncbi:hypothetical protein NQF87_07515 [Bombella sp. TMW 2.2559]|uniref:Uncharacterized protein n=1 Tax=Bombella dulcis TaxID=2967339 RepID=A0ABT3WGA9_9PROT|nr:hypothetical protein [Bombella dulcis]MCX5616817.1 hypothetical protein [Bombella dulcis]